MAAIELIVQGDDFGMCHAVNEGVTRAFRDGIVTQASIMAPCPWFAEAAGLAVELQLPIGLHQTLTCEWDYLRWAPLTDVSITEPDGTFRRTVADAQRDAQTADVVSELTAQARRAVGAGLRVTYLDVHMGMVAPDAYATVSEQEGVPFLYPGLPTSLQFDSIRMLSARDREDKKTWLLNWLARLAPGRHLLVSHPAVPGPEIASITAPTSEPWRWAEEYRASDLEVLTDPEVRARVNEKDIRLVTVSELSEG